MAKQYVDNIFVVMHKAYYGEVLSLRWYMRFMRQDAEVWLGRDGSFAIPREQGAYDVA